MSYDNFKNSVLGVAYDIDGWYGAQCWDGYAQYCIYLGYHSLVAISVFSIAFCSLSNYFFKYCHPNIK